jgi:hypothetical protein
VIAREGNQADLDLWAFVNGENEFHGITGRNFFVGRFYHRELMAVLGLELPDGHFGLLNLRRIELTLNGEAYLAIFETIEDVRFRYGLNAVVLDAADDGPLDHIEGQNFGVGVAALILNFKANVLKILGIPKGLEITAQRVFIVRIAGPGKNPGLQSLRADAPIAVEPVAQAWAESLARRA